MVTVGLDVLCVVENTYIIFVTTCLLPICYNSKVITTSGSPASRHLGFST